MTRVLYGSKALSGGVAGEYARWLDAAQGASGLKRDMRAVVRMLDTEPYASNDITVLAFDGFGYVDMHPQMSVEDIAHIARAVRLWSDGPVRYYLTRGVAPERLMSVIEERYVTSYVEYEGLKDALKGFLLDELCGKASEVMHDLLKRELSQFAGYQTEALIESGRIMTVHSTAGPAGFGPWHILRVDDGDEFTGYAPLKI